jgi:Ca2+-binding RTX toxin-like protein
MSSYATGSDQTLVNSHTTDDQSTAAVTSLADGGWIVTWEGAGAGADDYGIYQQRYAADGQTFGSETLVDNYTTSDQYSVSTTALASGGWVVTWEGEGTGDDSGIFQQRYAANGHAIGSETLVNLYTTNDQYSPTTTALADGGWLVTWDGEGATDSNYGIYQQRYAANGSASGSVTLVNSYTTNVQSTATTTALADGGWVVAWEGEGTGDNTGIHQQIYAANGDTVGSETQVNTYTTNIQAGPQMAALAGGGWVVTWWGEGTGDGDGVFQQRFTGDGDAVGSQALVNSYTTNSQLFPAVAALADGGWVVTWRGEGTGDSEGVFQQRYTADGDAVGDETLVNSYTTNNQYNPKVTALSDGGWVVTWDGEGTGEDQGIYQRHFAADIDGSNRADKLSGTGWGEYLIGYGGNDRLDGKTGSDVLVGGFGNDTYVVNSNGDQVEELAAQGIDSVLASISYTLGGSVENLILSGKAALNGTGNALANHITGNSGSNILKGQAGADYLTGGKGNDTLYGGADTDHFVFHNGDGADKIADFDTKGADHDVIDLSHVSGLSDFADLKAHDMQQDGSALVIDVTSHDTITLDGVKLNHLTAADFQL